MIKYVVREDGPVIVKGRKQADPQRIGEALEAARKATPEGGDMRAVAVEQARNRRHYLHRFFEWDDAKAAHQFRLIQVNQLICSIRVETDDGETRPAFISVAPSDGRRHFATPGEVVGSLELQVATLKAAERDLENWTRRYRSLRDLCEDVEETRRKIAERRAELEARDAAA